MNAGEYGIAFLLNVAFDLSLNTNLTLVFTKPDKTVLTVSSPYVALVPKTITTPDGNFQPSKYVAYITAPGDVDQVGDYQVRLDYFTNTTKLISNITSFTVYS